jgi:hypothetical protein
LQLEDIDFSKSRMVFTKDEIGTESLEIVKEESKSGLRKDLEILFCDFFANNDAIYFVEATAKDIKERFFMHDNKYSVSYIRKVIKDEMKMIPRRIKKVQRISR